MARVKLPLGSNTDLSAFSVNWDWDGEKLAKTLPTIHGQEFRYDANGNISQSGNRTVYLTAFDKPSSMYSMKSTGGYHGSTIEYDADFNRVYKQEANYDSLSSNPDIVESTIYVGKEYQQITDYENQVTHRYTINAGSSVIQIERDDNSDKDNTKYMLTDNLGSTNVIVDSLGNVQQKLLFDPWGMRQKADSSLINSEVSVNSVTDRGYTGHEMEDEAGLINMNARIYDPYLGRFLSADPVLPEATDMQQFNRYSYVLNNPFKYSDPTGNKNEDVGRQPNECECIRERGNGPPLAMHSSLVCAVFEKGEWQ